MIYLDNNATTPCDPDIAKAITDILMDESMGNPSSNHAFGWKAHAMYEDALENIAHFYNALPDDVVITSGASEANNQAIIGVAQAAHPANDPRKKIIVSSIEHKCVLNAAKFACDSMGYTLISIPVSTDGIIDMDALVAHLSDDVLLVSVMAVNNEVGTVQPIQEIGKLCKQHGIIFHVDGAQAGYESIDMIAANIDLLSLSGHKIYAPIGVGALIVDSMCAIKPLPIIHGGLQQAPYRSGTISPFLAHAMSLAVTKMHQVQLEEAQHLRQLRHNFLQQLDQHHIDYTINGSITERHPGNLNISLIGHDNNMLVQKLQPHVAISTGSACNAGVIQDSYVLKAMNLSEAHLKSAVRICFGRFNTKENVDQLLNLLMPILI
ncbi:cysteine desulfurase family protein [Wohlfahrtiimonas chitiniclastica]|uniref:cysteine desulfurase family protein n=1 Tax=Wohlfahrtiimonas chitiniclastica TaxID=400946 RepID=UPI0021588B8C|nr:cysteine desulfurase family protein [Wohlfahrtiimonas chitiniclastica]MDC7252062.1 cysteine desulfurase IscS [Wohlfahrtiimonas chitiniclastica]